MAGSTATIDFSTLRIQWASHSSMFAICSYWTISKDQLIRLKTVANLPPRHDRRFRFKPKRSETRDPTPREIEQACKEIQAKWDARTREERSVIKTQHVTIRFVPAPDEAEQIIRDHNRE
jgi:hypothetical protein